jgi:hypothetical protein
MPTKSEVLFDRYCELLQYGVETIPTEGVPTPDRLVTTPRGQVIAEIKELTPSANDLRQLKELQERGWTHHRGTPGARAYEKIRKAAPQLKARADRGLPCILVLYDNIADGGWRLGSVHLEASSIDFAMYGLQTVLLATESEDLNARFVAMGSGRGGRRQMSEDGRAYISAVQVLLESPGQESEPFTFTYHNYFAALPLPVDIFRGPRDRHFAKPAHPDESPQAWDEVHVSAPV